VPIALIFRNFVDKIVHDINAYITIRIAHTTYTMEISQSTQQVCIGMCPLCGTRADSSYTGPQPRSESRVWPDSGRPEDLFNLSHEPNVCEAAVDPWIFGIGILDDYNNNNNKNATRCGTVAAATLYRHIQT